MKKITLTLAALLGICAAGNSQDPASVMRPENTKKFDEITFLERKTQSKEKVTIKPRISVGLAMTGTRYERGDFNSDGHGVTYYGSEGSVTPSISLDMPIHKFSNNHIVGVGVGYAPSKSSFKQVTTGETYVTEDRNKQIGYLALFYETKKKREEGENYIFEAGLLLGTKKHKEYTLNGTNNTSSEKLGLSGVYFAYGIRTSDHAGFKFTFTSGQDILSVGMSIFASPEAFSKKK